MKYCEEYAALISAWLDGELDERQAARLHIHLFTCPGCRAYLADMQAMRKGFPKLEDVEVPEGFTQAVMDRVHKAATAPPPMPKKKNRFRFIAQHSAALACCLVVLILVGGHRAMLLWTARDIASAQPAPISDIASQESQEAAGNSGGLPLQGDVSGQAGQAEKQARMTAPVPETYCMVGADETDQTEGAGPAAENQNQADAQGSSADEQILTEAHPQAPASLMTASPQEEEQSGGAEKGEVKENGAQREYFVMISLTKAAAGDLLYLFDGKTEWEGRAVQVYYLTSNQYEYLLERLAEKNGALPPETLGTADANYAKVVVTEN